MPERLVVSFQRGQQLRLRENHVDGVVRAVIAKFLELLQRSLGVVQLIRDQGTGTTLRYHGIGAGLHLRIQANRPVVFLPVIGDTRQVIERVHGVAAARQQVLEIVPGRVKIIETEVDNCHQPQRVSARRLFQQNLIYLAQRIVVTAGGHHHQCQFHARVGVRVRVVADDSRRVFDRFVLPAREQQSSRVQQFRLDPLRFQLDGHQGVFAGIVHVTGLHGHRGRRVLRVPGILVVLGERAHDLVGILRIFLRKHLHQRQQALVGLLVATFDELGEFASRLAQIAHAQL